VNETRAVAGLLAVHVAADISKESTTLDVTTGMVPTGMTTSTAAELASLNCPYDERSVVVCSDGSKVKAVDATPHKVLWTITA
jgi:hypothetical protein